MLHQNGYPVAPPTAPNYQSYGVPGAQFTPSMPSHQTGGNTPNREPGMLRRNIGRVAGAGLVALSLLAGALTYESIDSDQTGSIDRAEQTQDKDSKNEPKKFSESEIESMVRNSVTLGGQPLNPDVCPDGMFPNGKYAASVLEVLSFPDELHRRPGVTMDTEAQLLEANVEKGGVDCESVATVAADAYVMNRLYGVGSTSVYTEGTTLEDFVKLMEANPDAARLVVDELGILIAGRARKNVNPVPGLIYRVGGTQLKDGKVMPILIETKDVDFAPGSMWEFKGGIDDGDGNMVGDKEQTLYINPETNQRFVLKPFGEIPVTTTTTTTSTTSTTTSPESAGDQGDTSGNNGHQGGGGNNGSNQGNGGTGGSAGPRGNNPEAGPGGVTDSPGEGGNPGAPGNPSNPSNPGNPGNPGTPETPPAVPPTQPTVPPTRPTVPPTQPTSPPPTAPPTTQGDRGIDDPNI